LIRIIFDAGIYSCAHVLGYYILCPQRSFQFWLFFFHLIVFIQFWFKLIQFGFKFISCDYINLFYQNWHLAEFRKLMIGLNVISQMKKQLMLSQYHTKWHLSSISGSFHKQNVHYGMIWKQLKSCLALPFLPNSTLSFWQVCWVNLSEL